VIACCVSSCKFTEYIFQLVIIHYLVWKLWLLVRPVFLCEKEILSPIHKGVLKLEQIVKYRLLSFSFDAQLLFHSVEKDVADHGKLHDHVRPPSPWPLFIHLTDLIVSFSKQFDFMLFLYQSFSRVFMQVTLVNTFKLEQVSAVESWQFFEFVLNRIKYFE
jgi:hypothetical protein